VRSRFILIVVALAVLAFAGLRHGDHRSTAPPGSNGATGQLAGQPAPDSALPAVVSAAATASAAVQTLPHSGWRHLVRPAEDAFTAVRQTPLVPDGATRRRTFPLLI
jgi:hypothetical protein